MLQLIAVLVLSVWPLTGAAHAQNTYPGVLQPIGALHCTAAHDENAKQERAAALYCVFRREGQLAADGNFVGRLTGSGLYLVDPSTVRLVWNVLAPTPQVRTEAVAGTYDLTARPQYKLKGARDDILYGGLGDTFALELLAPARLDGISSETKLTLQMEQGG